MSVQIIKPWVWLGFSTIFYGLMIVGYSINVRASLEISKLPADASNVTVAPIENRELLGFGLFILSPVFAMVCSFFAGRGFVHAANINKGVV